MQSKAQKSPEIDGQDKNKAHDRVEHASDIIGDWGPYQLKIFLLTSILNLVAAFQRKNLVYYAPRIGYWCKQPEGYENATLQTCSSYEDSSVGCKEWEYDLSFYKSTIIEQYDLVCERAWLVSAANSCFQIGYLISSIVVGLFSDRFGRLTALKLCVVLEIITGILLVISPNIHLFLLVRVVAGFAAYGRFLSSYLLVMESVGPRLRAKMSACCEFGFGIGSMLQPGIYYLVRDYRHMQLGLSGFESLIILLFILFKISESLRWQLTHGQFDKARDAILKAAAEKGDLTVAEVESKLALLKQFLDKDEECRKKEAKQSLLDVYREPKLLKCCLLLYYLWFAMSLVSYGISLNIGDLGGSLFVNSFVTAVAGSACRIAVIFIVDRFTRRKLLCFAFLGAAISYILMAFLTTGAPIFVTSLAFLGSFFIAAVFILNYLFGTEIFPTTVRHIGIGSCSVVARIGSVAAPFSRELTELTNLSVTLSIFGGLALTASSLVYFLPETQGKEIPDTISEIKSCNIVLSSQKQKSHVDTSLT